MAKKLRVKTFVSRTASTSRSTTFRPAPADSRFDAWLDSEAAEFRSQFNWFNEFRTPKISEATLTRLPARLDIDIINQYNLRTIDFGNWVSQFHRQNFNALLNVSLKDLASLVGSDNLGKGVLTIDWGGRGQRRALGLYKSWVKVINLRRHDRLDKLLNRLRDNGQGSTVDYVLNNYIEKTKGQNSGDNYGLNKKGIVWLLGSSGFGSFAHEFGHFLDNILYEKTKPRHKSSGLFTGDFVLPAEEVTERALLYALYGTNTVVAFNLTKADLTPLELAFFNVFTKTYYTPTKTGYKPSKNLTNIVDYCGGLNGNYNYWGSFCECWARIFEGWVQYALDKKGIQNKFLVTPEKKFEVQNKVIDGREVTVTSGRKVYPLSSTYPKINSDIKTILNIFAKT